MIPIRACLHPIKRSCIPSERSCIPCAANKVQRAYAEDLAETDPAALAQLKREGLPATEHMRGVTERPGQSQRMLADTEGGRITELGMGATTSSKRAVESAERAFGARMGEEFDEVSTLLASTMRSTTKGTEMANEAADNAAQVASKWYNKAYGAGPNPSGAGPSVVPRFIDLDPFRSFLSNRHFERAYKKLEDDINTKIQNVVYTVSILLSIFWKENLLSNI